MIEMEKTQLLRLKVAPLARQNMVKTEMQEDGTLLYRVYVTSPADKGQANKAVIALMAKELKLPKSSIEIVQGLTSRQKTIKITNI